MDAQLLARNLADSPIVPYHYRNQTITALGGKIEFGEDASRQGGTTIAELRWENGSHPAYPLSLDHLLSYCIRNEIFYVICPGIKDPKQIVVFVQKPLAEENARIVGKTLEGTLAAALVLLQKKD